MQDDLWLFMKGLHPKVQTVLKTVSATDSQAIGRKKTLHKDVIQQKLFKAAGVIQSPTKQYANKKIKKRVQPLCPN